MSLQKKNCVTHKRIVYTHIQHVSNHILLCVPIWIFAFIHIPPVSRLLPCVDLYSQPLDSLICFTTISLRLLRTNQMGTCRSCYIFTSIVHFYKTRTQLKYYILVVSHFFIHSWKHSRVFCTFIFDIGNNYSSKSISCYKITNT